MEMRCYRKILRISHKYHVTNEAVCAKIKQAIGPHEDLLTVVKRRKRQWYSHVSRSSNLARTVLQGSVKVGKKTRPTEGEVRRQHQGMDRPESSSPSPRWQWRTGENGGNWLRNHLWCPNDPRGEGIDNDDDDDDDDEPWVNHARSAVSRGWVFLSRIMWVGECRRIRVSQLYRADRLIISHEYCCTYGPIAVRRRFSVEE